MIKPAELLASFLVQLELMAVLFTTDVTDKKQDFQVKCKFTGAVIVVTKKTSTAYSCTPVVHQAYNNF